MALPAARPPKNLYICPGARGRRAKKGEPRHGEYEPGGREGGQERRVLHAAPRHGGGDERLPRLRPGYLPREDGAAALRRPGVEQLHALLRGAVPGPRAQAAHQHELRAGEQAVQGPPGSRPSSRRAARASARRGRGCMGRSSPSTATPTATDGSTSTTCSGTTSRGTATSAARR